MHGHCVNSHATTQVTTTDVSIVTKNVSSKGLNIFRMVTYFLASDEGGLLGTSGLSKVNSNVMNVRASRYCYKCTPKNSIKDCAVRVHTVELKKITDP